ncbi:MAG TPA: winged helix-turn-helix domain-containing protein [Actinomycetes bacterium]|nr:winged helix-turn-helix domain-containing protein [Actinomycetes bacterium]
MLRDGMIALAAVNTVGTAVELASLRHWKSAVQMIPWVSLAVLTVGIALLVLARGRTAIRLVRLITVLVAASSVIGVLDHIEANYRTGPLDFRYSQRWAAMSAAERWWAALSKSVGPAPSFAPAVLAIAAVCLFFATLNHPALRAAQAARGEPSREPGLLARGRGGARGAIVRTAGFTVDLAARRVVTAAGEVRLTRTEWHVLELLAQHPRELIAPRQLVEEVWGELNGPQDHELRAFMVQLQRKLEPDPSRPRHLLMQAGAGYWFEPGPAGGNGGGYGLRPLGRRPLPR